MYIESVVGSRPLGMGDLSFIFDQFRSPEYELYQTSSVFFILLFFSFQNLSKFLIWVILTTSQVLRKIDSLASNMSWVWLLIGPFSFKTPKVFIPFSFQISSERSRVARKRELLGNVQNLHSICYALEKANFKTP